MTRIVMVAEGIVLDPTGKRDGRGAYLCSDHSCWQRAASSDILTRALRQPIRAKDRQRLLDHVAESAAPTSG